MSDIAAPSNKNSSEGWLCRVDSINYVTPAHRGCVVLSGSHGGIYSAFKGLSVAPRGLILNDAGVGRNNAGIAVLAEGNKVGVAVATISHMSARIGDAADMEKRGIVSHSNDAAIAAGVVAGMTCEETLRRFSSLSPKDFLLHNVRENRSEINVAGNTQPVICIDSASLLETEDKGRIAVTGSHGGLIGNNAAKAINVDCKFAAFNDAGIGCDNAGIGRLAPLQLRGIAAVTVSNDSAEIGSAVSTLTQGIISHANNIARDIGAEKGMSLQDVLTVWFSKTPQLFGIVKN